jgi:hypothetical protein
MEKQAEWEANHAEVEEFATLHGIPVREELSDGTVIEMQKIENGIPMYYTTNNLAAAITTRTNKLWEIPVTGAGYGTNVCTTQKLGEWDAGRVDSTHPEFGGRVTQCDSPPPYYSSHSTHVAGTLIASGVVPAAKGMAYQAYLAAYDWNNANAQMAIAAAGGMEVSNHSYGILAGWAFSPSWVPNLRWYGDTLVSPGVSYYFGFYHSITQDWDQIAYDARNYLIVKSAGNDRDDSRPPNGAEFQINGVGPILTVDSTSPGHDYQNGGYDTILPLGVAKNILTVGAVYDVPNYTVPNDVVMSSFSGWGPADDGRIKPDLVGNGTGLYSTIPGDYDSYSGTSMSSPNVAGTLALLQQYYQDLNGCPDYGSGSCPMRSATLKALVIHTAEEAGANDGPDYQFGWGLLNAERAAQVIKADKDFGGDFHIKERTLNDADTFNITVPSSFLELRATIVWTDLPGTPVEPVVLYPTNKMLVNDLDLRIIRDSDALTFLPWVLDPTSPSNAATTGDNDRDNVEQVLIKNPTAGTYTIHVTHKGALTSPPPSPPQQAFSLIVTGITAFPNAGVDNVASLGKFGIRLTPAMGNACGIVGCPQAPGCLLVSPDLFDPNTRIGRSDPHTDGNPIDVNGALIAGIPLPPNTVKDGDFTIVPNTGVFKEGPIGTPEVHTQILDLNMTDGNMAVRAGNSAPDAARSIGEVESLNLPSGDFPAESFFDMFVEVDLPALPLPDPWNCIGGKTLINKRALVIQNGNLLRLPPSVVYMHGGATVAPLVYDKFGLPGDPPIGWITLAGHGVDPDFVPPPLPPLPEVPPGCGPGPHWVDDCPEPSELDIYPQNRVDITVDIPDVYTGPIVLRGESRVKRGPGVIDPDDGHYIDTELVFMELKGTIPSLGEVILRAGVGSDAPPSLGRITEDGSDPSQASFSTDVFFEIVLPNGSILHNEAPAIMKAVKPLIFVPCPPLSTVLVLFESVELFASDGSLVGILSSVTKRLPVTLDSFTATASNGAVALKWATGIEKDNAGFKVWRGEPSSDGQCSTDSNNYTDVQAITPLVDSKGTEVSGATYTMTDSNVASGNTYCYALEDIDYNGKSTFHMNDIASATP